MKILYLIILITLFVLFLLVKKTDKKQNIIFWIIIGSIILIPYNVLVSYILTTIGLKCTLLNYSICNILVLTIIAIKMFKDKSIQKYYIQKRDILALMLILILVIAIAYKQYGFPFNIKYETTDPGVHYNAAKTFYEQKVMLHKAEQTSHYGYSNFMPASYVNTGILFDLFSDIVHIVDMYCIYIVFDLIVLFLMGMIFYYALIREEKSKVKFAIATILSIIFILGYPLNSMLFGFAYLSTGIMIITAILAVARFLKQRDMNTVILSIVMFLLMYGIFFSYYLFVPVVYSALGIYFLIDIIKNRKEIKILSKENIIKVIVIFALPTVLGFIYFILPGLLETGTTAVSHMNLEGYIYRDLYINFIAFAPFMLYYIIQIIKNKKNSFSVIFSIILLAFIAITFIGGMKQKVSSYYYFKSYYCLWIVAIYMTYRALCYIIENKETSIFAYMYLLVYTCMNLFVYFGIDQIIINRNVLFNPTAKSVSILDIQTINTVFVNRENNILNRNQVDAIKYLYDNIEGKDDTIVYGDMLERIWVYVITGVTDSKDLNSLYECPIESIEDYLNSDKKYLLYIVNDDSKLEIDKNSKEYSIKYSNEYAVILEKN